MLRPTASFLDGSYGHGETWRKWARHAGCRAESCYDRPVVRRRRRHEPVTLVPPLPADVKLGREFQVGYEQQREVIEYVFSRKISLIASALGPPPDWMIEQGRRHGVKVAALAGTVEHARKHVEAGVDIVVAQGYEAGGRETEASSVFPGVPEPPTLAW